MTRLIILFFLLTTACSHNKKFTIYSGDKKASFFKIADGLCKVFNQQQTNSNLECVALESHGALENLELLNSKKADLAIIKTPEFNKFFLPKISNQTKFVANLHQEYLTILVRKNSKINSLSDLAGKSVNIGSHASSSAVITQKYLALAKITPQKIYHLGASDSFKMLCQNQLDAWIYFVGHPNSDYAQTLANCDVKLLQLSQSELKNFSLIAPFFKKNKISKNFYPSLPKEINTISSDTILASRNDLDPQIISALQDILQNHKSELIKENPIFSNF